MPLTLDLGATMAGDAGLQPQLVLAGIGLGESPRWHGGELWFADWPAHEIVALAMDGARRVELTVAGMPFCFDWDQQGRLLVVTNDGGHQLVRREGDGTVSPFADLSAVMDKPWNEIVVDGRGNAYVNSIGFEMMRGEAPAPGVIAVVEPHGRVRQVAAGLEFPNGMAVSPDNRTLIVAESYGQQLTAFDIEPDGGLANRRVWAKVSGYPDGISLDADGAVWCAAMTTCVRIAEGGDVLDTVELDRSAFACAVGGGDDDPAVFIMAAEWNGPEGLGSGPKTGQVLRAPAPAAHSVPSPAR
jgi:sugar lactone lactonase YvrE